MLSYDLQPNALVIHHRMISIYMEATELEYKDEDDDKAQALRG